MFICHNCGSNESKQVLVNEIFNVEGKHVLVEKIPSMECMRCGEKTFSRETTEKIRKMVHGKSKPKKSVSIDVFAYA